MFCTWCKFSPAVDIMTPRGKSMSKDLCDLTEVFIFPLVNRDRASNNTSTCKAICLVYSADGSFDLCNLLAFFLDFSK